MVVWSMLHKIVSRRLSDTEGDDVFLEEQRLRFTDVDLENRPGTAVLHRNSSVGNFGRMTPLWGAAKAELIPQSFGKFEDVPIFAPIQCFFTHKQDPDQLRAVETYMRAQFLIENDFFDPKNPKDIKRFMMYCVANFPELAANTFHYDEEKHQADFGNRMKLVARYYCWLFIHDDLREATGVLGMDAVERMNALLDKVFEHVDSRGKDEEKTWEQQQGWLDLQQTPEFRAILESDADQNGPKAIALAKSLFKIATRIVAVSGQSTIDYFRNAHLKYTQVNAKEALCRELGVVLQFGTPTSPCLDEHVGWLIMRQANAAVTPCIALVAKLVGAGDCAKVVGDDPLYEGKKPGDFLLPHEAYRREVLDQYLRYAREKGIKVDEAAATKRLEELTVQEATLQAQEQRSEWIIGVENCLASACKETQGQESGNTVFTAFIARLSNHLKSTGFEMSSVIGNATDLVSFFSPKANDLKILAIPDDDERRAALKARSEVGFVKIRQALLHLIFMRFQEKPLPLEALKDYFTTGEGKSFALSEGDLLKVQNLYKVITTTTQVGPQVECENLSFGTLLQQAFEDVVELRKNTIQDVELVTVAREWLVAKKGVPDELPVPVKQSQRLLECQRRWEGGHPHWTFASIRYMLYTWGGEAKEKEGANSLKEELFEECSENLRLLEITKGLRQALLALDPVDEKYSDVKSMYEEKREAYISSMIRFEKKVADITAVQVGKLRR